MRDYTDAREQADTELVDSQINDLGKSKRSRKANPNKWYPMLHKIFKFPNKKYEKTS